VFRTTPRSRKLSSKRWTTVLERFIQHLADETLEGKAMTAADASG